MKEVNDIGKVWIRGSAKPVFAVRVDSKVYIPGKEDEDSIEYWFENEFLCFDLHNTQKRIRVGRRFSLNSIPATPATLFSGFEKTHHADVLVATEEIAETFMLESENYKSTNAASLDSQAFWQLATSSWS